MSSYLTHSTFSVLFPAHLLVLKLVHPTIPLSIYYESLKEVLAEQVRRVLIVVLTEALPWCQSSLERHQEALGKSCRETNTPGVSVSS